MSDEAILGMQSLLDRMDGLPLLMQKAIIVQALTEGAEPIRAEASRRAPVRTGKLRESIIVQVVDQTAEGAIAKIGPSQKAFYGRFVEVGTIHQKANPFLRPALDEKQDEALRLMSDVLAREIEKALKT